jgi:hypothetical protein
MGFRQSRVGIKDRLAEMMRSSSNAQNYRQTLDELGIQILSDERLADRIKILTQLHILVLTPPEKGTPEFQIQNLRDKLDLIDNIARTAAVPWGRAGDNKWFAEYMLAYEKLVARTRSYITCIEDRMQDKQPAVWQTQHEEENEEDDALKKEELDKAIRRLDRSTDAWKTTKPSEYGLGRVVDKRELVRVLQTFVSDEVFPYSLFLIDVTFVQEDVVPSWAMSLRKPEDQFGRGSAPRRFTSEESNELGNARISEQIEDLRRAVVQPSLPAPAEN